VSQKGGIVDSNWALVYVTFGLVALTGVYAILTDRIARKTGEAAQAARESAQAAERSAKAAELTASATQQLADLTHEQFLSANAPKVLVQDEQQSNPTNGAFEWTVALTNHGEGVALRPDLFAYVGRSGNLTKGDLLGSPPPALDKGVPTRLRHHIAKAVWRDHLRVVIVCHYVDRYHTAEKPRVYHSVYDDNREGSAAPEAFQDHFWPERPLPEDYQRLCPICYGE